MKTRLWVVLPSVVAWPSFLIGYSVSALTGGKPPAAEVKGAGGYAGAAEESEAGAGGDGAGRPKARAGGCGGGGGRGGGRGPAEAGGGAAEGGGGRLRGGKRLTPPAGGPGPRKGRKGHE